MGETENSDFCSVCREVMVAERTTRPCAHTFCRACYATVVAHATSENRDVHCPYCARLDATCKEEFAAAVVHLSLWQRRPRLPPIEWMDVPLALVFCVLMLTYAPYLLAKRGVAAVRERVRAQ